MYHLAHKTENEQCREGNVKQQKFDRTIGKCFLMMPSQYNAEMQGHLLLSSTEPQQWGWLKKHSKQSKGYLPKLCERKGIRTIINP